MTADAPRSLLPLPVGTPLFVMPPGDLVEGVGPWDAAGWTAAGWLLEHEDDLVGDVLTFPTDPLTLTIQGRFSRRLLGIAFGFTRAELRQVLDGAPPPTAAMHAAYDRRRRARRRRARR